MSWVAVPWAPSASVRAAISALPRGPSVGFAAPSPCFRIGMKSCGFRHLPYREAMGEYAGGGRPRGFSRAERIARPLPVPA